MRRALLLIPVILLSRTARADDSEDTASDPPTRVGRLSAIDGDVSFKPAAVDEWVPATTTRPITAGDAVWTDQNARAELHIGSLVVRIDQYTSLRVLALDDKVVQLALAHGRLGLGVRDLGDGEVLELDLPNTAVHVAEPGKYVISYDDHANAARVAVRAGSAALSANDSRTDVSRGQSALIDSDGNVDLRSIADADEFERWGDDRDQAEQHLTSLRYVPRTMTGYDDLDRNGSWDTTVDYGAIWYPTSVPSGWVPYRAGHWAWVAPWGWTWIDDFAWGFAPFHYGRWVSWRGRWGWCPGALVARPVYAPALVAWVNSGSVGVGWFPLGPHEVFMPSYAVSHAYVRQVNVAQVRVTHVGAIDVTTVNYVNRPHAYTVVPQGTLIGARPVAPAVVATPTPGARVVVRAPVAPTHASYVAPVVTARPIARPPERVFVRPVVTARPPAVAAPVRPAYPSGGYAPPAPARPHYTPPTAPPVYHATPAPSAPPPVHYTPPAPSRPPPAPAQHYSPPPAPAQHYSPPPAPPQHHSAPPAPSPQHHSAPPAPSAPHRPAAPPHHH